MTTRELVVRQWIVAAIMAVASVTQASNYTFKDLAMNDYEDMEKLIRQTSGANVIDDDEREPKVRDALKMVMSRRNTDGKRTALFTQLQGQLPETFFALAVHKVAETAIAEMKESTNSNVRKATGFITLENLLSEIQPRVSDYRSTIELIKNAEIEVTDGLRSYRRLEGMDNNESPSSIAKSILDKNKDTDKEKELDKSEKVKKAVATISPDFME